MPSLTGAYDNYRREFFQKQKIEFLTAIGKVNEAEELIKQHLDITEIRQAEIEKAIHKKDYEQAKQLIKDGIKIAQKKNIQVQLMNGRSNCCALLYWKKILIQ
jgi:hypothetical protein